MSGVLLLLYFLLFLRSGKLTLFPHLFLLFFYFYSFFFFLNSTLFLEGGRNFGTNNRGGYAGVGFQLGWLNLVCQEAKRMV